MKPRKKAQQEIMGFVLIVVLVVIALLVFLVISLRSSASEEKSIEVDNLLSALMKTTTECAIIFEPQYDTFEDLFKSCYKNDNCQNLDNKPACDYLQEKLNEQLEKLTKSEATINAYELDFFEKTESGEEIIIPKIISGNCTSQKILSAQKYLISDSNNLVVRMKVCKSN